MLFPLVESCLSEEVLRAWQRNNSYNDKKKEESRLKNLMQFLKNVEERINLAMKGFSVKDNPKIYSLKNRTLLPGFLLEVKALLTVPFATKRIMKVVSTGSDKLVAKAVENSNEKFHTLVNPTCSADVLLRTLVVYLYGNDGNFPVRALIDTGSQKSYITKEAVSKMSYEPIRAEDMIHNLFWWCREHCRVVFGIKSSPFLLGATLNHLLDGAPDCYKMTAQHLQKSMYVDNCVASVKSEADLTKFINESREIMALGKFELRGWQHNSFESLRDNCKKNPKNASHILQDIPVLGLLWNIERDTLKIDVRNDTQSESVKVTKRYILSKCHKIFDPIGITAPITLIPKILLQETWKIKANWDDILPEEIAHKFEKWDRQLHQLNKLEIPRWIQGIRTQNIVCMYFAMLVNKPMLLAFFKICEPTRSYLSFSSSKITSSTSKKYFHFRLELLGCCIGLRLAKTICTDLEELGGIPVYYWSDSMNCLYWIKK
ncbi:DUF1758 domain-containing protein [Caerostris extrusa]|uniref:DUF1758 domain-containing protein n=1 Tax=Caerostris extrusa TaxID=172846 RepID=A0AAV4TZJ2_CAEEX|nr:DUF1758 domain-containing protein [Caerostris extrusa]